MMARKSLGFTQLLWVCPNCETRNLGTQKTCTSCGTPQPEDVEFIQGEKEELMQLQAAAKSADIHCPFCGTRNKAEAEMCSQCGGKLTGGKKRKAGRVVGAYKGNAGKGMVCPACGFANKPNAARCAQCGGALKQGKSEKPSKMAVKKGGSIWMVVGLVVVVIIGFLIFKGCSRETAVGVVSQTAWTRTVAVEQFVAVTYEDWWDEIPAEAYVTECEERYRTSSDEPEDGAIEVCGTPYTVDTGTGVGEVVMDCEYEVYDTFCEYEVSEWDVVEYVESEGYGLSAAWPSVAAFSDQRAGGRNEEYTIWFDTADGNMEFTTEDYGLYQAAANGSAWELTFDGYGNVVGAAPQ